jgi:hypothetical protein
MKNSITLFLTVVFSFSLMANVSVADKKVLMQLYQSTDGLNWKTKWNLNALVETWYGIKVENDKVVSIVLTNNNLVSTLPDGITGLKGLAVLNLFKNQISGKIPSTIGKLKNLRELDLSFNKLSGEIPCSFCEIPHLKTLNLFMNNLSGELPSQIGNLK